MIKYVFIQDEPYFLPKVLDKYLREFHDSTAGINIQSVAQGKRTVWQTARDLYKLYGFWYFQWKLRQYASYKIKGEAVQRPDGLDAELLFGQGSRSQVWRSRH